MIRNLLHPACAGILLLVLIASCKKKEDPVTEDDPACDVYHARPAQICVILANAPGDTVWQQFTYDAQNRITGISNYYDYKYAATIRYTSPDTSYYEYAESFNPTANKYTIVSSMRVLDSAGHYVYAQGWRVYDEDTISYIRFSYQYDPSGQLTAQTGIDSDLHTNSIRYSYANLFYWINGNLTRMENHTPGSTLITEYEYLPGSNGFFYLNTPSIWYLLFDPHANPFNSRNLVSKQTVTNNGMVQSRVTYDYLLDGSGRVKEYNMNDGLSSYKRKYILKYSCI